MTSQAGRGPTDAAAVGSINGGSCGGGWGADVGHRWHRNGVDFDLREAGEDHKRLRLWCHNVDGSGGEYGLSKEVALWKKYEIDVVMLQDVRLSGARLASALTMVRREWGGSDMKWVYEDVKEKVTHVHGVMVLVRSKWAPFVHGMIRDDKGWGRYAGVILVGHGVGGKGRQMAVVSCYAQGRESTRWKWEAEKMGEAEGGEDRTPAMQYREDLGMVVNELESQKVCVILGGDFNFAWAPMYEGVSCGGKYAAAWKAWVRESRGMVNAAEVALRAPVPTYAHNGAEDDKDMIFLRSEAAVAVAGVGVLDHETLEAAPTNSMHWPVMAEVAVEAILGVDGEQVQHPKKRVQGTVLRNTSNEEVKKNYADGIFDQLNLEQSVCELEQLAKGLAQRMARGEESTYAAEEVNKRKEEVMAAVIKAMVDSEKKLHRPRRHYAKAMEALGDPAFVAWHKTRIMWCRRLEKALKKRRLTKAATVKAYIQKRYPEESCQLGLSDVTVAELAAPEALSELKEARIRMDADGKRRAAAELKKRRGLRAEVIDGYTKRGKKVVKMKKLIDVVCDRARKAGPYASLAVGKGEDRRVITVPGEVAKLLVDKFRRWMGYERVSWYSGLKIGEDSPEGLRLRQRMACEMTDSELLEFMREAQIPEKFKPIVVLMQRKKAVKPNMYRGLMKVLGKDEWSKFWQDAKKGTAAGRSGVTVDMVALLNDADSQLLRRLVNLVLSPGVTVYEQWKMRIVSPVPKEEGNFSLEKARPLVLLDVLQKAFWAMMTARMTRVWEEEKLLHPMQFGFRRGHSVTAPALMATLIAEKQVKEKKPMYVFSQDISKAYDTVARHIGKEIAWRRLGLPEEYIQLLLDMDRLNKTVVVTAFGLTDDLLGEAEGVFEYERGFCQGASESPAGWVALYDVLLELQSKYAGDECILLETHDGQRMEYVGSVFADDAMWVASSREGIEVRLNVANLFLEFMDITFNTEKSSVMAVEWQSGMPFDLVREPWRPKVFPSGLAFQGGELRRVARLTAALAVKGQSIVKPEHIIEGPGEEVTVSALDKGVRWLGYTWSPMLRGGALKDELESMVMRLERQMKETPVSAESTLYLSDAVVWGRVSYKAFIGDLNKADLDLLEKKIRYVFLEACRLPKSLSKELVHLAAGLGGLGWTSWYDRLMKMRVTSILKWVATETPLGFMYRWALEQVQLDCGVEAMEGGGGVVAESICDSPRASPRWMEQTVAWMEEKSLHLAGGGSLPGGVPGDIPLVELADSKAERAVLRKAAKASGRVWLSQVLGSGDWSIVTTPGMPDASEWKRIVAQGMRRRSGSGRKPPPVLDADRRATPGCVRCGDVVAMRHDSGKMRLWEVRRSTAVEAVLVRLQQRRRLTGSAVKGDRVTVKGGGGAWDAKVVESPATAGEWKVEYADGGVVAKVGSEQLAAYGLTDVEWSSGEWYQARGLVASGEMATARSQECTRVPTTWRTMAGVKEYTVVAGAKIGKKVDRGNRLTYAIGRRGGQAAEEWVPEMDRAGDVVTEWNQQGFEKALADVRLEAGKMMGVSDGSQRGKNGTYGWVMMTPGRVYSSSGKVKSYTRELDSYRSELQGVLSMMAGAWRINSKAQVRAYCDNRSVVDGFKRLRAAIGRDGTGVAPKFNHSVDLWEEVEHWCRKWRQQFVLEWSKGHPEKRDCTRASWTPVDWMNHVADRAAEAEYGRAGGDDAPGCLRHQGRWRLEWNGMRVTSVTNDALNWIQEELPWRDLLREQQCDPPGLDVQATKIATGYTGVAVKRTQNVRMMWDRYPLRANMWHWRQRPRQQRSGPLWWYHDEPLALCQVCSEKALEDVRHVLGWCGNETYKEIRTRWYERVQDSATELAPALWEAIRSGMMCVNGSLQTRTGAAVAAWHAATGKIPILWTEAALGAGVERPEYDQWLRRFGKEARTELWWPLMKARRQLREAAGDRCEHGVGDESAGESDESDDVSD